jgi:hypothetical protein
MLVVSYNPGYQSVLKEIKPSTRQRFVALEFDYPEAAVEAGIVATEGRRRRRDGAPPGQAGELTRNLKGAGLDEGASTRLLVHAAQLIADGVAPAAACTAAVARALTDDPDMTGTLDDLVHRQRRFLVERIKQTLFDRRRKPKVLGVAVEEELFVSRSHPERHWPDREIH